MGKLSNISYLRSHLLSNAILTDNQHHIVRRRILNEDTLFLVRVSVCLPEKKLFIYLL